MAEKKFFVVFGVKVDAAQLSKLEKRMMTFQNRTKKVGQNLKSIGTTMTTFVSAPIAAFAALTLRAAGNFEAAMNQVAAKTNATGADLDGLREKAKKLGATTQFSASEAAMAMIEFAKAGLSVDEIMGSVEASLSFASAAQLTMGEVATIAADAMAQFGLKSSDVGDIADTLTKAANSATTDVRQLAQALSFAGPIAGAAGVSIQETSILLAALANNGVKASRAGTALANTIGSLRAPTGSATKALAELGLTPDMFVDASGRMKMSVKESLMLLKKQGVSATQLNKIFEKETARSLAGLMNNLEQITVLEGKMQQRAGFASAQGKKAMEGFNGAMKGLVSALEAVQIAVAESGLLEWSTKVVKKLADFLRSIAKLNPNILKWGSIIAGVVAILGLLITGLGFLFIAISGIAGAFAFASTTAIPFLLTMGLIALKVILIVGFLALLGYAVYLAFQQLAKFAEAVPGLFNSLMDGLASASEAIVELFKPVTDWLDNAEAAIVAFFVESIPNAISRSMAKIGEFKDTVMELIDSFTSLDSVKSIIAMGTKIFSFGNSEDKKGEGVVKPDVPPVFASNSPVGKGSDRTNGGEMLGPNGEQTPGQSNAQNVNVSPEININMGANANAKDVGRAVGVEIARAARSAANSLKPALAQ